MDSLKGQAQQSGLQEELELCRRELAQVREQQEKWMEQAARLPVAERARDTFARALAVELSSGYWTRLQPERVLPGGLRGRLLRWILGFWRRPSPTEELVVLVEQSRYFDPVWYLVEYPDVLEAHTSPAEHFLLSGAAEGRDPGPEFSTAYYLKSVPGLAESGMNPLVHFVRHGQAEGRHPAATTY